MLTFVVVGGDGSGGAVIGKTRGPSGGGEDLVSPRLTSCHCLNQINSHKVHARRLQGCKFWLLFRALLILHPPFLLLPLPTTSSWRPSDLLSCSCFDFIFSLLSSISYPLSSVSFPSSWLSSTLFSLFSFSFFSFVFLYLSSLCSRLSLRLPLSFVSLFSPLPSSSPSVFLFSPLPSSSYSSSFGSLFFGFF